MNRLELKAIFDRERVRQRYYSFEGPASGDILALEEFRGLWTLSTYSERGGRDNIATFATEDEGCRALFAAVATNVLAVEHRTILL